MVRCFLIVFLTLAVGVTFTNREAFFRTALYEEGDLAANALQIHRAKHLRELHGNYSRWGFHHPGPAFFYVYAASERLLHDVTGIAPAPHNAHLYGGTLLQLAFYAAAIALLARHARRPALAVALAIVAAAAHYSHVERAFFSIWPPDALLMPFLCFIVACAAVARADRVALPVLVVSGSFLVHGHIAQPLFVVPLTAVALFAGWRSGWRNHVRATLRSRESAAAFAGLGVFLLPIVIDLFAGKKSNAYDVLLHLRYQTDAGQSLWQSVLCYAGYFVGFSDATRFNQLSPASYAPFRENAGILAAWAILLGGLGWRLTRREARVPSSDDSGFGRSLLFFWSLGSLLTLVWGMKQDGGFTNFNSHFNYSLVHVLLLIAIVVLVGVLPAPSRLLNGFFVAASVPVFLIALPFDPDIGSRGDELTVRVPGLLHADPKPDAPKLITFAAEDWYEAVTLGRAFQRLGLPFFVHSNFGIMFGEDKLLSDGEALGRDAFSIWHVVRRDRAPAGARTLNREGAVVFPAAVPLPGFPTRLDFGAGEHAPYSTFGFSEGAEGWVWTEGPVAALRFESPAAARAIELTLNASGLTTPLNPHGQRVNLRVNGEAIGRATFGEETQVGRWAVPAEIWNRQSPRTIVLELPDAIAPADVGGSGDRRALGLRLYQLTLAAAQ